MQLLFHTIAVSIRQCIARGAEPLDPRTASAAPPRAPRPRPSTAAWCAGTDFSRSLPLLGPKRLWDHLAVVAVPLLQAAPLGAAPDFEAIEDAVIGVLYGSVFGNHVKGDLPSLQGVLGCLRSAPKLSATTHGRLPTPAQVRVTLQNIAWVMQYWSTYNAAVATPLDGTHGFVRCPRTAQIAFADTAAA